MKKLILLALLFALPALAQQSAPAFEPLKSQYSLTAGTSGTAFQVPQLSGGAPYLLVQYSITNSGSVGVCAAYGPTSASVATVTIPPPGTGTISTAGNCYYVMPANTVILSAPDGSWWNIITASSTALVYIAAGFGP